MPVQNVGDKDEIWDTAGSTILVDGIQCLHFIPNEEPWQGTPQSDHTTTQADDYGYGVTLVHHADMYQITINLTVFDSLWQKILDDTDGYQSVNHTIDAFNQSEHIHTTTATLPRLPAVAAGNGSPNRTITFNCIHATMTHAA